ncbi:MAG TPA: ABC transporter permease [Fusibacter sp.]|nr:ABC transporter permease [Fusibacter sp.]
MNEYILTQMLDYLNHNMTRYLTSVQEHIWISLLALMIAMAIGVPSGYIATKYKRADKWLVSVFQILRVIPSLAVLILLIPILGTGLKPAMTALVLLAVPPILLNTIAGLTSVPDFMIETAYGMGMTENQVFSKVKLPLALPLILTGIKTAMIEIIASATLASKIGAGGLGDLIFTGLGLNRTDLLLLGGLSVAFLSIFSGLLLDLVGRATVRYKNI